MIFAMYSIVFLNAIWSTLAVEIQDKTVAKRSFESLQIYDLHTQQFQKVL